MDGDEMKKPKIKKRKGYWLVYNQRKNKFKCYSFSDAELWYRVLSLEK
jgi:hypothetical protein